MPADDLRLAIRIRADVQRALANMRGMERSLGNIDRRGRRADRTLRSMGRTVLRLGAAYLGLRAAVGVIRSIVGATEEQSQAVAQMERGLRNLRGETSLTSAGLQEHAAALQRVTTTGDEAIIRLQSLLLTFRQIDDSNFNRVVEASLDLAAAIGQAPRDAALQLGKALEDPVQGLTALRRSGTVFSQEQTAVIRQLAETNRLAEAQALILAEVERQYRGAARAQRETVGGAGAALSNTIGDLLEHRDGAEDLRLSIEGLNEQFKDPATQAAVRGFVDLMVDGFAAIVRGAGAAVDAVSQLIAAVHPDIDSRAERVRTFGQTGEGITTDDLLGDERLLAEARRQRAALQESIAQRQAQIAEQDSALFRRERDIAAANRAAAQGAALGLEEILSGGRAQTLADQEREGSIASNATSKRSARRPGGSTRRSAWQATGPTCRRASPCPARCRRARYSRRPSLDGMRRARPKRRPRRRSRSPRVPRTRAPGSRSTASRSSIGPNGNRWRSSTGCAKRTARTLRRSRPHARRSSPWPRNSAGKSASRRRAKRRASPRTRWPTKPARKRMQRRPWRARWRRSRRARSISAW